MKNNLLQLFSKTRRRYPFKAAGFMVGLLCCLSLKGFANVIVTPASGGTLICSNKAADGSAPAWTNLGTITVTEGFNNDILGGTGALIVTDVLTLDLPAGWQFNTTGTPTVAFTLGQNIQSISITSFTATSITVSLDVNRNTKPDAFTISGLQVQATSVMSANGNITASTAATIAGVVLGTTNFGSLSQTPGPINGAAVCEGATVTLTDPIGGGTWTSSDPTVASIGSTSGLVTGVASGTAIISYTAGGCTTFETFTVNPHPAPISGSTYVCVSTSTTLTDASGPGTWATTSSNVTVGASTGVVTGVTAGTAPVVFTLASTGCMDTTTVTVVTVIPPIGGPSTACVGALTTLTNAVPGGTWSSSSTSIAIINSFTGVLKGMSPGVTSVSYVVAAGCSTSTLITVNDTPASVMGPTNVCLHGTAVYTNATAGGDWSTNLPAAGTIDATGTLTALALASFNVIYTIPSTGCFTSRFVHVNYPPDPITGGTYAICDSSGTILSEAVPGGTWSSSDPTIADVDPYGVVSGYSPGAATISYTVPGCPSETYPMTVNPLPDPIEGLTSICIGGLPTTLTSASPGGIWTSSDTTIATVDPTTGEVTAATFVSGLTATITYTLPTGCLATYDVNTNGAPVPIVGVDSVCYEATTTWSSITPGGIWSSSNLAIAQVIDTSGVVYGVAAGIATISYTLPNGCAQVQDIRVLPAVTASVSMTEVPGTALCSGTPVTFTPHPVNGGTPTYLWKRFGVLVDTGATFTYTPTHGDFIMVEMIVHGVCAFADTVMDTTTMNVYPDNVVPTVTITDMGMDNRIDYIGQIYTFYSEVTYGGSSPSYQWYVNGAPIAGATNATYSRAIYENDTVFCKVTGNAPCNSPVPGMSNGIIVYAQYLGVNNVSGNATNMSLIPNPSNGNFVLSGNATGNEAVNIEITDMLGHTVYTSKTVPNNGAVHYEMKLSNTLADGTYLLRASSASTNEVFHLVISK